jgi:large subunit ribosomal protein L18
MVRTQNKTTRRLTRVRKKLAHNITTPRLSVFRSNVHIWAQIIDDKKAKTLLAFSTKNIKKATGTKTEQSVIVGTEIARLALEKNIKRVRFDRGSYKYHGRVKALADAARVGGLQF